MTAGRPERRSIVEVTGEDPFERGRSRGMGATAGIRRTIERYFDLFRTVGIGDDLVRRDAATITASIAEWSPELGAELAGVAAGSGVEPWRLVAVNARTEILSRAVGTRPGECSTIVCEAEGVIGAQTWDWHEELDDCWHLQHVRGSRLDYVGLTEFGIIAKIGINSAGVGVMLNILGHREDRPSGVPVHLVCARVLAEATSLAEALDILMAAPVTTSSAITLLTPAETATVELSPLGAAITDDEAPTRVHTNHFLVPRLREGENRELYEPDSQQRRILLADRARRKAPSTENDLIDCLGAHLPDGAEVCCHAADGAAFGQRWSTLATVAIEPEHRSLTVFEGGPLELDRTRGTRLAARPIR